MATPERFLASGLATSASRVCAGIAGMASSTASNPACTWRAPSLLAVVSCQAPGRRRSGSMRTTCASVCRWPASCSGVAQACTRASMRGAATQCGSLGTGLAATTRPAASSTRTVLALQGRHRPGWVCSTRSRRGSRTVKYCAPASKLPKGLSTLRVRPPGSGCCSNTLTWCPACTRVRAQAMPATPRTHNGDVARCLGKAFAADGGGRCVGGFGHGRGFLAEVAMACTPLYTPGSRRCTVLDQKWW
jgi:hypothetical protein